MVSPAVGGFIVGTAALMMMMKAPPGTLAAARLKAAVICSLMKVGGDRSGTIGAKQALAIPAADGNSCWRGMASDRLS